MYVYMETVEETKDKGTKSAKDGSAGGTGVAGGKSRRGY
jgi:hypothetical protein